MRRAVVVPIVGALAAVLGFASAAWGCFVAGTDPYVRAVSPSTAPAGSRVTVTGGNWVADSLTVRWASPTGPVLGESAGDQNSGSFSLVVVLPAGESPGVKHLYVVQAGSPNKATPVQISAPRPASDGGSTSEPAITANSTSGAARPPVVQPAAPVAAAPAPVAEASPANTSAIPGPPANAPAAATRPAAAATSSAARAPAQQRGAALNRALPAAAAPAAAPEDAAAPGPSARSAAGELWPGFSTGSGAAHGLQSLGGADQVPGTDQAPLGLALSLVGLVALFAGFGVAELRRLRVTVRQ